MITRSYRLAGLAVATAAAVAVPVAALAADTGTPAKPTPTASASAGVPGPPGLAGSAGLTDAQLQAGLLAAKRAGGNTADAVTALARATGVSPATARRLIATIFGAQSDNSLTGPAAVAALARQLGVSRDAALRALLDVGRLSQSDGGVDPQSPAFAAIAHQLGVSPARLATALDAVKRAVAGR